MLRSDSLMCRGGFELRRLCVLGMRRPTAHTCWQRHLAQQPLLLLEDGTLLEAQLQQDVQVLWCGWRWGRCSLAPKPLCESSQVSTTSLAFCRY